MNKLNKLKKELFENLLLDMENEKSERKLVSLYLDKAYIMGKVEGLEKAQQIRKEVNKKYENN